MQRTNIIQLQPNKTQIKILKELMLLSSCVYNSTNYLVRQEFFNNQKSSGFYDIKKQLQTTNDYQLLGRSYSSPRMQIYFETNSARFKLLKSKTQKKVGLPKYFKNRKTNTTLPSYLVIDNCQYRIDKNFINIPLSRVMRKKYNIGQTFKIRYNGILKHKGNQQRGQIHFDNGHFYFYQSVEVVEPTPVKSNVFAGLDIGIKKFLSIYINNDNDKTIGSNRFYKQWKHYTNLIADEQQKLSQINRYSSSKLLRLYRLRSKWQNNLFNNIVAKMFRFLNRNKVSKLVVGDLKDIREDNNTCKELNKMIHNYWSFSQLCKKIENKCEEFGIELIKETEEYTSQTCPMCLNCSPNNKKDRIFVCNDCGYIDHRDVIGARNILTKGMYGSITSIHWNEIVPLEVSQ